MASGQILHWGTAANAQNITATFTAPPATVTGSVDTNTPGTYSLTYTASNSIGGQATVTRTVVVRDTLSPDAIDLGPAETVTCTFTSRRDPGLTVTNVVEPADATQLFDFALAPGTTFQLGHQSRTFDLTPGTYALTATTPA